MIMSGEMICCNIGSTPTFQTSMGSAIFDLTLASVKVVATIGGWKVHENAITSDHRLITFENEDTEEGEIVKTKSKRYNVQKADWNEFRQKGLRRSCSTQIHMAGGGYSLQIRLPNHGT